MMRVGCATAAITPTASLEMGGYAARQGKACGAHDDLTARALAFEQDGRRFALVVADLLMFSRRQSDRIRRRAGMLSGIDPADVIVTATHTHSGPVTFDAPFPGGQSDPAYVGWMEERVARTVSEAVSRLEPARVGWGRAPVAGVGAVRRAAGANGSGSAVTVLGFAGPDGELLSVLMHYACHPTVMGADNRLYTADLLGAARAALERRLGRGVPVVAVNGACGDVSTRFTRREQSFAELERLGRIVADAAIHAMDGATYIDMALSAAAVDVELPLRPLPTLDEAMAAVVQAEAALRVVQADDPGAVRLARVAFEGAQVQAMLAGQAAGALGETLETVAHLVALRFGSEIGLVTIPGELFASLGEVISQESGLACCLPLGYSGGHLGYIPDVRSYEEGGYEVLSSHLARGAGQTLAKAAAGLFPRGGALG